MNDDKKTRRGRDIPWLPVVRFHKEIAARAESSFFSIHARESSSERWSSIESFEPSDPAGPWKIDASQITSNSFKLALEQGDHESLFLGGPCYLGWQRGMRRGWMPQWRPVLYREVRLLATDGVFEVIPAQGYWSISPLVTLLIERLQLSVGKDYDEFARKIIEQASSICASSDGTPLSYAIKEAISNQVSELENDLRKLPDADTFHVAPTQWVFFAPSNSYSALTRYLMADYSRLEHLLEDTPNEIGGLQVLDDGTPLRDPVKPDLMPLVPLNEAQERAVESILGNQPLTVISGPPGCGKSQVVVSLLLNAWAKGTPVLFASNNNSAVDVVRERLEHFEAEFPIAVRAGNRQKNNIVELLRRTINYAGWAQNGAQAQGGGISNRKELVSKRRGLEEALKSKLPQRADEGLRTALNAYAEYKKILDDVLNKESSIDNAWHDVDLKDVELSDAIRAHEDTDCWLKDIGRFQHLEEKDIQHRQAEQEEIQRATTDRNEYVSSVGVDSSTIQDWNWLVDGPSPRLFEAWEDQLSKILDTRIDDALEPFEWQEHYGRWSCEEEAASTSNQAKEYSRSVRSNIAESAPRVSKINRHADTLEKRAEKLGKHGLEEKPELSTGLLREWTNHYSILISLPQHWTDFLPWSHPKSLKRKLKKAEAQLRPFVPLSIWRKIGLLNTQGRANLSEFVEVFRLWKEALDAWNKLGEERKEVEKTFESMRAQAGALGLTKIPEKADPEAWKSVVTEADELSKLSSKASEAWRKKTQRDKAVAKIERIIRDWRNLASGHPLKESWSLRAGEDFVESLNTLARSPTHENMVAFRSAFYSGSLKILQRAWSGAIDAENIIHECKHHIARIPSRKDRVHDWLAARPEKAIVAFPDLANWPNLEEAHNLVHRVHGVCESREHFQSIEKPKLLKKSKEEYRWAVEKLHDAIAILPSSEDKDSLKAIYAEHESNTNHAWPVDEISKYFQQFSPELIKAQIANIDAELERGSFEDAKAAWLQRLSDDEDAVNAVDHLERAIRQNRGSIKEEDFALFRRALRVIPIWITTAQAAQAIPLEPELFDLVVIDEASQCTLTNLLPLLYRGKRLAIIGDSEQLPAIPTVQESEELALAQKYGVEEFLKIIGHANNDVYSAAADALPRGRAGVLQLVEHFRSNPQIIGFSNRHIYQQRLLLRTDPTKVSNIPIGSGVHRISVNGSATRGDRGRSWQNIPEAECVMDQIVQYRANPQMQHLSIGVVTPFAAQKEYLRERMQNEGFSGEILVDSAYGFQGDERDVILFSAVVSRGITASASRWVESPPNLINVALTRARLALVVVADFDYCMQQDPSGILRKLAEYCRDVQLLRDTSPAELELFSWMILEGWIPDIHPRIADIEVDFALKEKSGVRLVIEVDGGSHDDSKTTDQSRDAFLTAEGWRVFRTPARSVLETPYNVIQKIKEKLKQ